MQESKRTKKAKANTIKKEGKTPKELLRDHRQDEIKMLETQFPTVLAEMILDYAKPGLLFYLKAF